MSKPTYPFARSVARRVHAHLKQRLAESRRLHPQRLGPEPDVEALEAIIDAGFWASLRHEEGYPPRISLVYLPPTDSRVSLMLEQPLPLAPEDLTRLAPAVEHPSIHLGVWRMDGRHRVWGSIRSLPALCFVLEVASPGVLVIKYSSGKESAKFVNFAVLESNQVKILDREAPLLPGSPAVLKPLLGLGSASSPLDSLEPFAGLAVSMRAHGHGGSLLVVPGKTEAWRESVVQPVRYSVAPSFTRLAEIMRDPLSDRQSPLWRETLQRTVDVIAGLTAVDGATVMTDQYELLAFGANIRRRDGATQAEQVLVSEPIEGDSPRVVPVPQLGGTRHLSAAQFVQDQRDAVALVASQDSRFTVFSWSARENMVQAHRVDTFLL